MILETGKNGLLLITKAEFAGTVATKYLQG
jgi:hypothetical protein